MRKRDWLALIALAIIAAGTATAWIVWPDDMATQVRQILRMPDD